MNIDFLVRIMRSSKNWQIVIVAALLYFMQIDKDTIAKIIGALAGIAIAGNAVEDGMKKLGEGKK